MLRSSIGFHTMSLFLRLTGADTQKLIEHFYRYKEHTGLIRMRIPEAVLGSSIRRIEWKEYSPKYIYEGVLLRPIELKISYSNMKDDRGIKWTIRSDRNNDAYSEVVSQGC